MSMLSNYGSLNAVLHLLSAIPVPVCSQDILTCDLMSFAYMAEIFPLHFNPSSVPGANLYGSVKPHR